MVALPASVLKPKAQPCDEATYLCALETVRQMPNATLEQRFERARVLHRLTSPSPGDTSGAAIRDETSGGQ